MISWNLFPCLLSLSFDYCISCQLCRFRCKSGMFCIIFPTFFRSNISPDVTWIFIDWVSVRFLRRVFFPWPKKKTTSGKSAQKWVLPNSVKNIFPDSLSRKDGIYSTPINILEKSNDSYKLPSLADFSLGASSERQLFRFDTWLSFPLWWYLSLKVH